MALLENLKVEENPNAFEQKIELTRNAKCGRGWVAEINLETETLNFLRAKEGYVDYEGTFRFENMKFYIRKYSASSWKNSRDYYDLVLAFNNKLIRIIEIDFISGKKEIEIGDIENEELKEHLIKKCEELYEKAERNKTTTALIKIAKIISENLDEFISYLVAEKV